MDRRHGRLRRVRGLWLAALALVMLVIAPIPAEALSAVQKINVPGFGDSQNSYSWTMAWFNGKLYVGTARSEMCVEYATYAFYGIRPYSTNPAPGVTCPSNPFDMNLQAEIWQYTPKTGRWLRVYQSPLIPNPVAPGKMIARDIAYRGMVVYQNQLYVLGVTADEIIPPLRTTNPPRILRTMDGTHFTALDIPPYQITYPNSLNNYQPSPFYPMGYRSYAVYNNRLFVTATPSLTGDGALMEITDPAGPHPTVTQDSPSTMQIFEINTFNNQLYIGGSDPVTGYMVLRTDATGGPPFNFTPIVTGGAGRGKAVNSVVSMSEYNGRLYVGASGWYIGAAASELIRINPDDSWDLVVGNPRLTAQGYKAPISGLPDGFGNPFNAHFWRMQSFGGALYVGTNDTSWLLYGNPLANLLLWNQYGFDVYYTCDGNNWFTATTNAFGNGPYNFGARSMAASTANAYIGSANQAQGTVVWSSNAGACPAVKGGKIGTSTKSLSSPMTGVQATVLASGTAVSWDAVPGAVTYHVLRSDYVSNKTVGLVQQQTAAQGFADAVIPPTKPVANAGPADVWFPGPFKEIGKTTDTVFVDTSAVAGQHYAYEVEAEDSRGNLSPASNVAFVPDQNPPATFDSVTSAVNDQASQGDLTPNAAAALLTSLEQAKSAARSGKAGVALQGLDGLQASLDQNTIQARDAQTQLDLQALVDRLQQRIQLFEMGLLTGDPGQ